MSHDLTPALGGRDHLLLERRGAIAIIHLNRPDQLNAFTAQMTQDLFDVMRDLDSEVGVRAIIVTGRGRVFSAGATLEDENVFAHPDGDWVGDEELARFRPVREMRTPVIGALNGSAAGMGIAMTLAYDVRFVAADAKYVFNFTRLGIVPEVESTWMLPRLVGLARATEILLSGRTVMGIEAAEIGLAVRAVPAEDVLDTAIQWTEELVRAAAPASVALTKRLLNEATHTHDQAAVGKRELDVLNWLGQQPDALEGVRAFMQKRDPSWSLTKADA